MTSKLKEGVMQGVFTLCACVSILAVALICIFLFANGLPAMKEIGVFDFLLGKRWKPGNDIYGIFPMILGSIYVTAGAAVMKMNTELGYVPVTFNELTDDEAFWKGCEGCTNHDILVAKNRKFCICTAMLYDPTDPRNIKKEQERNNI